jgi:hypothetical protein
MAENRSLLKNAGVPKALNEVYSYRYTPVDDRIKNSQVNTLNTLARGEHDRNGTPWVCTMTGNKVEIYRDIFGRMAIGGRQPSGNLSENEIDEQYLIPLLQRSYPQPINDEEKIERDDAVAADLQRLRREYSQFALQIGMSMVIEKMDANVTPLDQRNNFYFQSSDSHYYIDAEYSNFLLMSSDLESKELGVIPGSIKVKYQWNGSGFEIKELNFSNEVLASLLEQHKKLSWEELKKKIPLIYKDENQFELGLFQLNRLVAELDDEDLKKRPTRELLNKIQVLKRQNPKDIPLLTEVVLKTCSYLQFYKKLLGHSLDIHSKTLSEGPSGTRDHILNEYAQLMNRVSKQRSWGKIIAGTMLALVAASVVGLCCATGFGVIALPFMAWGLTTMLSAAGITLASAAASVGFFVSAAKDSASLKELKSDMNEVVENKNPSKTV